MKTQKVLIFGHPHCGTSILKSIIGHAPEVDEIVDEVSDLKFRPSNSRFQLGKYPKTLGIFFQQQYEEYEKIFTLRNPIWVYSSLNRRFGGPNKIPQDTSLDVFIKICEIFEFYRKNPKPKLHTILYEEMFERDHQKVRKILKDIGISDVGIFNNQNFKNKIVSKISGDFDSPPCEKNNHAKFRTWQINQPFINNNEMKKIEITRDQRYKIMTSPVLNRLFNFY